MAIATASEVNASILVISEPNKTAVKGRQDWVCDDNLDVALKVFDKNLTIKNQGIGAGFSYVTTKDATIYSCNTSGNKELVHFETMLEAIEELIKSHKGRTIITGDFNAKSAQWGMNYTDIRGHTIVDWMAANNLVIANEGITPTFQCNNYTSILDLTIVSENVNIQKWTVMDRESLSDHKYITFECVNNVQAKSIKTYNRGWRVDKLNKEKLKDELGKIDQKSESTSVKCFNELLTRICDRTMAK
ncbi:uncharacterized protein LOC115874129 [Sitophilus oryzae]|uniref:Uncharacterized protein LOC115874129 n=1 Tax=Sitophilus oryzae TaxID=7048 RepID=A0A6J2X2D1_SITOR|nr:uncharacterized protein LOC115874129 [Sitophilus oryzae]